MRLGGLVLFERGQDEDEDEDEDGTGYPSQEGGGFISQPAHPEPRRGEKEEEEKRKEGRNLETNHHPPPFHLLQPIRNPPPSPPSSITDGPIRLVRLRLVVLAFGFGFHRLHRRYGWEAEADELGVRFLSSNGGFLS